MIISKQIPFDLMLKKIGNGSVFLFGCNECARLCHVGGEVETIQLKNQLEDHSIIVTGWIILDPACHLLNNKRLCKPVLDKIKKADHLLILSCGNGIQVVQELFPDKHVISGTDSLFLGAELTRGTFEMQCQLCGSCVVDEFEGLCPVSRCPKQLLNGPCGGSVNGDCEIGDHVPCVWDLIIKKKQKKNTLSSLQSIIKPKDWTMNYQYNWRNQHKK